MTDMLLAWLERNQESALLLVPLFAFMETCIGIGLFVSSLFLVIACSIIYANGWAGLEAMIPLALLGSSLGDHVGYYVGRAVGPGMHELRFVRRYRSKLEQAEGLVRRYGSAAIFIGRFIPAIRSLIPALLGLSEFPRWRYTALDLAACGLWALALGAIVKGANTVFVTAT
jgi:membrane-associated protein